MKNLKFDADDEGATLDVIRFYNHHAKHLSDEDFIAEFQTQFPNYHFVYRREVGDGRSASKKFVCEKTSQYKEPEPRDIKSLEDEFRTHLSTHGYAERSILDLEPNEKPPAPSYISPNPFESDPQTTFEEAAQARKDMIDHPENYPEL